MHGSLTLKNGILYVGRYAKTAVVSSYDLDGHPLETAFTFRDEGAGRSSVSGLAVDDDHRVWVADAPARRVRAFTLFGQEVVSIGGEEQAADRSGLLGAPVDVLTEGQDDELLLWVASGGSRRHAVQRLHPASGAVTSLRPSGGPRDRFRGVRGIARHENLLLVCESAGQVLVFRDDELHYAFGLPARAGGGSGARAEPTAVATLSDGRAVLAVGGEESGLLLMDLGGRLLRVLAEAGEEEGRVSRPSGVAVAEGDGDRRTRIWVIDRDGERVQVFTLDGRCYGAFRDL